MSGPVARTLLAVAVSVACVIGLSGCIQQSARQLAVDQAHQAIKNAEVTLGNFAVKQPTDQALTVQLAARAERYPSAQGYDQQQLEGLNLQKGQLLTYETDADRHQEHVIAVGSGQALGPGGSASADVHSCAILTASPGSEEVKVEQETCPDVVQEAIASHWGEAVSPE